jgi:hypothetical protein
MADDNVDAAALLAAVVIFVGLWMVEDGAWNPLNSVIATAVAFIVHAYCVATPRWRRARRQERQAVGVGLWLVLAIAMAWPGQWVVQRLMTDEIVDTCDQVAVAEDFTAESGRAGEAWFDCRAANREAQADDSDRQADYGTVLAMVISAAVVGSAARVKPRWLWPDPLRLVHLL